MSLGLSYSVMLEYEGLKTPVKQYPGCSNHDCWISPPKGMGTNGLCHCLDELPQVDRMVVKQKLRKLKEFERKYKDDYAEQESNTEVSQE